MEHFGTDGIRKKANAFTPEFIAKIIRGLTNYAGNAIRVLIGGDTRESTEWILSDLESALETYGVEYSNVSVLPTPAINYCFYEMGFDFAIDVTASHNPYEDNGIKIFERGKDSGVKLSEEAKTFIEKSLSEDIAYEPVSPSLRENLSTEARELYIKHLKSYIGEIDFSNLKLGMDCANGATSVINKTVFESLGASITLINSDENFNVKINDGCGSTHLDTIKELVKSNSLDFGMAFDGDGDRVLFVDETGAELDGDFVLAILTDYLKLDSLAVTVMANQGLLNWANDNHINLEITSVGDSNVAEAMKLKNIKLGGEQSGHIILPNEPTGDGMLTALIITKVVAETKKSLHELSKIIKRFPQVIVNLPATPKQKESLKEKPESKALLLEYDEKLKAVSGRLLVRPSGTEPLIRITMWGENENEIIALANELKTKLGEIL